METARWTPDPQLASALDAEVRPYQPLLENIKAAGLVTAVHPLENIIFWSPEIAYWMCARGTKASELKIPIYAIEMKDEEYHIADAALNYANEMSGVNDNFRSTSTDIGTEVISERFGTRLTSVYTIGESIKPTDPDYVRVGAVGTNFRKLGYRHPKVRGKFNDIRVMLGSSDIHEVTTHEDERAGISVFEAGTNVGATLYQVVIGDDAYLYAKRDPSIKPTSNIPLLLPDGRTVRGVTDPDIARDMARAESPFWLMQQNARDKKLPLYVSKLFEPEIFWNGEKMYWSDILGHRPYYDDFVERHIGHEQARRTSKKVSDTDMRSVAGAANNAAFELLSGSEGVELDEWGHQIRSAKYGRVLTYDVFHSAGSNNSTYLPYTHPIMKRRLIVSGFLGADESKEIDVTPHEERERGKTIIETPTNLGLTLFTTINPQTGPKRDYRKDLVLSVKRV